MATEKFSQPGRSSIDQTILKQLTMDQQFFRQESFDQCSINLTRNYDRIIHTAAALFLLGIGIFHQKIHSIFSSIQKMIHRVKTAFGPLEYTYGGDDIGA